MTSGLSGYFAAVRGTWNLASGVSDALARSVQRSVSMAGTRPSRRALRTGILAPGDAPPSRTTRSFKDYREILLPRDLEPLRSGVFPVGFAKHPQKDDPDFAVYLDWWEVQRHVAIVGPSGSGKTHSLIAPWVVAAVGQGMTAIAVDTKGDLLRELGDARTRVGAAPVGVIPWDVEDPTSSRSWNPLAEVTTPAHAHQIAQAILGEVDPRDSQKFFAERDHRWLPALIRIVTASPQTGRPHPKQLYRMVIDQQYLIDQVRAAPHEAHAVLDLVQYPPDEFARATAGLSNRLAWLADPNLDAMLAGTGRGAITLSQALSSSAVIVIGGRVSGGERSQAAAAMVLNLLRLKCLERFGANPMPVFWMLDEAARYADRIQLGQMLDVLRGANSPVCLALQDVAQLGDLEAQNKALANCNSFIALRGVSASTAEFLSRRLGNTQAAAITTALDHTGRWTPTLSHVEKPILGTSEIMQPPVGTWGGIVHVGNLCNPPAPFLVTFTAP